MTQSPAIAVLLAERDKLTLRLDALAAEIKEVKVRIRSFDDALVVLGAGGNAQSQTERQIGGRAPLKSLILDVLTENPGLGTQDIRSALLRAGRDTDTNTILGTLSRMKRDDASIHKRSGVWFVGDGESAEVDVDVDVEESEKAPDRSGAPHKVGNVAELDDRGSPDKALVKQAPDSYREHAGSSPAVSSSTAQRLMSNASPLFGTTNPKPPWQR
jgi:hypothetical protein